MWLKTNSIDIGIEEKIINQSKEVIKKTFSISKIKSKNVISYYFIKKSNTIKNNSQSNNNNQSDNNKQ